MNTNIHVLVYDINEQSGSGLIYLMPNNIFKATQPVRWQYYHLAVRIFYERKLFMSLYIASLEFSLKHLSDKMQNVALANLA